MDTHPRSTRAVSFEISAEHQGEQYGAGVFSHGRELQIKGQTPHPEIRPQLYLPRSLKREGCVLGATSYFSTGL